MAALNSPNGALGNPVCGGQGVLVLSLGFSNCDDLSIREDSVAVSLAPCLPSLADLICLVILICPVEEVPFVTARRIVAAMEDAPSGRNGAMYQRPGENVRADVLSINSKGAVAGIEAASQVRPALVRATHFDLRPKPLDGRWAPINSLWHLFLQCHL